MRPSPLRHPLAILRRDIDLTQKQLADLAECSRPTIQAIELGKLQLSEKLAQRIAYQTGVAPGWLLDDDVAQPPTRGDGTPFTQETFELALASLTRLAIRLGELEAIRLEIITAVERLAANCSSAYKADKIWLWAYKVEVALAALEKQFGTDKCINQIGAACYPQMKKCRPVIQPIIDKWGDVLLESAESKVAGAKKSASRRRQLQEARETQ